MSEVGERKFRRRGEISAVRWFKLGDHPGVIRRERWPEPRDECWVFWLGKLSGGFVVEPGDWICTDEHGRSWSSSPERFERMWQPCDSDEHRDGEDREDGLSGEAMPARAEGIAHPIPGDHP